MTTWGIVATIKAKAKDVMSFVAYHLDLGADEIQIYLDAPCPRAQAALAGHPKVRVTLCDARYWKMRRPREEHQRPPMHQGRQFANAKWAYMHTNVDWLLHIDVDEFLWPDGDIGAMLSALPDSALCARLRPIEALSSAGQDDLPADVTYFKSTALAWDQRRRETLLIYPTFGPFLNGGFLSHVAGKMAVRTGHADMMVRIHNVEMDGVLNPGEAELPGIKLCHFHAHSWEQWHKALQYRLKKGSYRAELAPPQAPPGTAPDPEAMNLYQLFALIAEESGTEGLRSFYDEVCVASPALRAQLASYGHLHVHALELREKRQRHFGLGWG